MDIQIGSETGRQSDIEVAGIQIGSETGWWSSRQGVRWTVQQAARYAVRYAVT